MTLALYRRMQEDLGTSRKYGTVWIRDVFLQSIYRNYVIYVVKEPLMNALLLAAELGKTIPKKAIMLAAKLLPIKPERSNCRFILTFNIMEIWDEFFENYNCPTRKLLFEAFRDLSLAELEHDEHYKLMVEWFIKKIVERVNDGRLTLRQEELTPEEWQAIYVQKGRK